MDGFSTLEYINVRLMEMGFPEYTLKPVRVQGTDSISFTGQNEYYFLISKSVPSDLVISSDNNVFTEAVNYSDFSFLCVQEFTGRIDITATGTIDLEFIRVIPRVNHHRAEQLYIKEIDSLIKEQLELKD